MSVSSEGSHQGVPAIDQWRDFAHDPHRSKRRCSDRRQIYSWWGVCLSFHACSRYIANCLNALCDQTIVGISNCFVHSDPEIFPEPHIFNPSRWLESDAKKGQSLDRWLVAFGKGPRSCLGQKYVPFRFDFSPRPETSAKLGLVRAYSWDGECVQALRLGTRWC